MDSFTIEVLPKGLCIAMTFVIFPRLLKAPIFFYRWSVISLQTGIQKLVMIWNECGRNYISPGKVTDPELNEYAQVLWSAILKKYPEIKSSFHGNKASICINIEHKDGKVQEITVEYCISEFNGNVNFTIEELPKGKVFKNWREFDYHIKSIIKHPTLASPVQIASPHSSG